MPEHQQEEQRTGGAPPTFVSSEERLPGAITQEVANLERIIQRRALD